MRSGTRSYGHAGILVALAFALLVAGPAQATTAPADAWITTKVKISLATTDGVRASDVNVDTVRRQVTLYGTVRTPGERQTAERTAKAISGVEKVRNLLQVIPPEAEVAVQENDEEIAKRVSAALTSERSLEDSILSVQGVNNGVVLLEGNARTLSDHLTAVEVAGEVKGVRRVASEIESPDALADEGIWKQPDVVAGGSALQRAQGAAEDLYTTSMVKMRLLADADTPALDINVDTRKGVVTLFGMVPTAGSKAAAEADAKKVGSVIFVKNQLQVVASVRQTAVMAADDVIADDIRESLDQFSSGGEIAVVVKNCAVRLTGTVPSGIERVEAMQVARATVGVCSVSQDFTVE